MRRLSALKCSCNNAYKVRWWADEIVLGYTVLRRDGEVLRGYYDIYGCEWKYSGMAWTGCENVRTQVNCMRHLGSLLVCIWQRYCVVWTHAVMHWWVLAARGLSLLFEKGLHIALNVPSCMKTERLNTRMFVVLCEVKGPEDFFKTYVSVNEDSCFGGMF
jgi:hypothetical protein